MVVLGLFCGIGLRKGSFHNQIVLLVVSMKMLFRTKVVMWGRAFLGWMVLHRGTVLDLLLILLCSLVPLLWFRGDSLIYTGDINFPLSGTRFLTDVSHGWSAGGLGKPCSRDIANIFPYGLFLASCDAVGLSLVVVQKIVWCLVFAYTGLSMYFLCRVLIKENTGRIVGLVAAGFYMFNLTALMDMHPIPSFYYASLPLILAMFVFGLDGRRGAKYALVMCLVCLVACTEWYVTPTFAVLHWALILAYFGFYCLTTRDNEARIHALKFISELAVFWVLLNMFWIAPGIFGISNTWRESSVATIGELWRDTWTMHSASLLNGIRLQLSWALHAGYKGDAYFPWAAIYSTRGFQFLSLLAPLLACVPLLTRQRMQRGVLFLSILAVGGLFLIKGPNPPAGELNSWLMGVTRLYVPLRMMDQKIGPFVVLAYAFLIGCAISAGYEFLKSILTKTIPNGRKQIARGVALLSVICPVVLLMGVYAWPLWTGDIARSSGDVLPSDRIKVPAYYYDAAQSLEEQDGDFRLLSLPMPMVAGCAYWWNGGSDGCAAFSDPTTWLLPKATVNNGASGLGLAGSIASELGDNGTSNWGKAVALLNVKYVILHKDCAWQLIENNARWSSPWSEEAYEEILGQQSDLKLDQEYGDLALYENESWKAMHVYAASNATAIDDGISGMLRVATSDEFTSGESVLLVSEQLNHSQKDFFLSLDANQGHDSVSLSYRRVDATKYQVTVSNATRPFFLVLSETYDSGWKAYVNSDGDETNWIGAFFEKSVSGDRHFTANGYANAWYIDPAELEAGEEFSITLYYQPQSLFYLGLVISGLTFVGCVGFLVWDWRRGRRLKTRD